MMKIFMVMLCVFFVFVFGVFVVEVDDDDMKEDMLWDFWKDEMVNFEYMMMNVIMGELIEGVGVIVVLMFLCDKVFGVFENDCV